jgi:protein TonB
MPVQTRIKLASLTSIPSARGVPNIVDEGALKSYIGRVRRSVLGAKRYPEASRRAGREGKLKVQFTILKNGEVGNVRLLNETPYPNLNQEAMAAVKRAAPFAGIPDSIMQQSLNVVLPFRFELN